jgi:hypothetical protein
MALAAMLESAVVAVGAAIAAVAVLLGAEVDLVVGLGMVGSGIQVEKVVRGVFAEAAHGCTFVVKTVVAVGVVAMVAMVALGCCHHSSSLRSLRLIQWKLVLAEDMVVAEGIVGWRLGAAAVAMIVGR